VTPGGPEAAAPREADAADVATSEGPVVEKVEAEGGCRLLRLAGPRSPVQLAARVVPSIRHARSFTTTPCRARSVAASFSAPRRFAAFHSPSQPARRKGESKKERHAGLHVNAFHRGQVTTWSFTIPTACMKA